MRKLMGERKDRILFGKKWKKKEKGFIGYQIFMGLELLLRQSLLVTLRSVLCIEDGERFLEDLKTISVNQNLMVIDQSILRYLVEIANGLKFK